MEERNSETKWLGTTPWEIPSIQLWILKTFADNDDKILTGIWGGGRLQRSLKTVGKHLEGQNWSSDMFISFLLDYSQQLSSYKSEFHLGLVFLLIKWWDDTKVANSYHLELYWQLHISKKEPKYVRIHIGLGQLPTQLSPSIQPFKEWRLIPSGSLSKRTEWLWSVV